MGTPSNPSTHLADLLSPAQILPSLDASDASEAIRAMVDHLCEAGLLVDGLRDEAVAALLEREERTSTGVGAGVAIPHAFVDSVGEVLAVFAKSPGGIDFESIDNSSVEFVVLFLVPEAQHHLHLKTLAAIARLFQDEEIREGVRNSVSPEEILKVFERGKRKAEEGS